MASKLGESCFSASFAELLDAPQRMGLWHPLVGRDQTQHRRLLLLGSAHLLRRSQHALRVDPPQEKITNVSRPTTNVQQSPAFADLRYVASISSSAAVRLLVPQVIASCSEGATPRQVQDDVV
jgi:hypothetical protein